MSARAWRRRKPGAYKPNEPLTTCVRCLRRFRRAWRWTVYFPTTDRAIDGYCPTCGRARAQQVAAG